MIEAKESKNDEQHAQINEVVFRLSVTQQPKAAPRPRLHESAAAAAAHQLIISTYPGASSYSISKLRSNVVLVAYQLNHDGRNEDH